MLVLSRRENEKVLFPNLGISVEVLRLENHKVRLGIDAPKHIQVLRDELVEHATDLSASQFPELSPDLGQKFRKRLHTAAEELCRLYEDFESSQIDDAEPAFFRVYRELRSLDDEVAQASQLGRIYPSEQKGRKRALLVDDNYNESRLLAGFLRCRDFEVDVANNGATAMHHLAHRAKPDCVLLDMNMPKFDGRWTIQEIRNSPKHKDLSVFAVSGMHPAEYGVDLGPQGVNQWFRKPLDPEALILQIDQHEQDKRCPVRAYREH